MVSPALGPTGIAGKKLFGSSGRLLFRVGLGDGPANDRREPATMAQECLIKGGRFCSQPADQTLHGRDIGREKGKANGKHRQAKRDWQGQKHSTGKQQKNAENLVQEWHQAHGSSVSLVQPGRKSARVSPRKP